MIKLPNRNSHPHLHPYPRHPRSGPRYLFDLARLRVPTDYESDAAVKKLLTTVPVRCHIAKNGFGSAQRALP